MTNLKKALAVCSILISVGAASITTYAATVYKSPAEVAAEVTGKTVDSIIAERNNTGKTYGTIANEAGKLDEFKSANLQIRKDILSEQVATGKITQENADAILKNIEENQANCDGTGLGSGMCNTGLNLRNNQGGRGTGAGLNRGSGRGMGLNRN